MLGLWCAGTRAWRWSMAGGRARPLASNSEPRHEFNGLAGLLVFATKPTKADGGEDAKSWRHGHRSREADGGDGHRRARRDGRRTASRAIRRSRREWRLGLQRGGGNLPARGFWWFSQNRPPTGFASPIKTVLFLSGGTCGGITEDASMRSKVSKGSSLSDGWTYIFPILPLRAF